MNKNDKDTLTNVLERYKKTTLGRLVIYKREEQNLIYKIGILWMKAFKDFYKIKGNRTEDIISRKDFNEQNYVSIEDVSFRIMPFEWFSLYANCNHHCKEKADYHKEAIMSMLSFCKEMKILEQRPIKRLKSDPYYQE